MQDLPQPDADDGPRRTLARGGVELRLVGPLSRADPLRLALLRRWPADGRGAVPLAEAGCDPVYVPVHAVRLAAVPLQSRADTRRRSDARRQLQPDRRDADVIPQRLGIDDVGGAIARRDPDVCAAAVGPGVAGVEAGPDGG